MTKHRNLLSTFLCVSLAVFPALVLGDCTCDTASEDRNKSKALQYKIGAIFSILVASTIGVCIPILGKIFPALSPEKNAFFMIKAFAAGVILSTGFIHVLPDAFDRLTSPCLNQNPWGNFPFAGFVAMVAAIGTLMVDAFATSYFSAHHHFGDEEKVEHQHDEGHGHVHSHATQGHSHGSGAIIGDSSEQLIRHRVISQVLELGIVVHSVIIGISLGASESPKTIRPLIAALTFHQFFEGIGLGGCITQGIGLGGCITQAKFKSRAVAMMGLFFSLTTPVGIAIGIGISSVYNENSPTALIVEGIFNSASSGILIYMALVDLLAADFMNPRVQSNGKLQLGVNIFLLLGAGFMSLLAKWA